MNVELKFGDHFYQAGETSWVVSIAFPVLGLVLSLLGLFLTVRYFRKGIANDKIKEERQKKEHNVSHLRYAKELLKGCIKSTEMHLKLIKEFISEQEKDFTELALLKREATNNFFRLKSMDRHGVFDAWLVLIGKTSQEIEKYQKLNAHLDLVEGVYNEGIRLYENNVHTCSEHQQDIEGLLEKLPNRIASAMYMIERRLGNIEQRWQHPEWSMLSAWLSKKNALYENDPLLKQLHDEFVFPLLEQLVKEYRGSFFTEELTSICRDIRVRMNKIKMHTEHLIAELRRMEEPSRKSIKYINDEIGKINKVL